MKHRPGFLLAIMVVMAGWCAVSAGETVQSKWSVLKSKIKYGANGEFKGTLEDGRALLGQVRTLLKEAEGKNPALAKIIKDESRKLSDALDKNKKIVSVDQNEEKLNASYEEALACEKRVKEIVKAAEDKNVYLTEEELTTIDGEWEKCLKILKQLKATVRNLRKDCNRLSGEFDRKWDEFEGKVDRLRDIAEKARDELRMRRRAKK